MSANLHPRHFRTFPTEVLMVCFHLCRDAETKITVLTAPNNSYKESLHHLHGFLLYSLYVGTWGMEDGLFAVKDHYESLLVGTIATWQSSLLTLNWHLPFFVLGLPWWLRW